MRRLSRLLLVILASITYPCASAAARVTASDAAATHAYLEAKIVLRKAMVAAEPAELQAIHALAAQVQAECPGLLSSAPAPVKRENTNQPLHEVDDELLTAGFGTAEHLEHPADVRFARAVHRLRWSNPRLTLLLHDLASEQAEQSGIKLPNLCSDMKFWVASRYSTVSAGTKEFLHRHSVVSSITQIESEPNEPVSDLFNLNALVAQRLKPYENHADRLLARKALPPEPKITDPAALQPLGLILEAVAAVFAALGTSAPPGA